MSDLVVETLRGALAVIGTGPCRVNECEGCRYEMGEAGAMIRLALAALNEDQCVACGGRRLEDREGPDGITELCKVCKGTGINPAAWKKYGVERDAADRVERDVAN